MEPLAGPWRELEASVQARSVLATFDYNATWYHHYEDALGGDPLIGVARRGSDVVGIAPLVIRRRRVGRVPLTCIEFAAHEAYAGEFAKGAKQFVDYQTFHSQDVENSAWRYLCVARG